MRYRAPHTEPIRLTARHAVLRELPPPYFRFVDGACYVVAERRHGAAVMVPTDMGPLSAVVACAAKLARVLDRQARAEGVSPVSAASVSEDGEVTYRYRPDLYDRCP